MTKFELLSNIDFDNSYNNVLSFDSEEKQSEYFDTKVEYSFLNFSIVRPNEEVKVQVNINDLNGVNYCRYENVINGKAKTFYAFILSKEYVNPITTRLILETDIWQTYMFDFTMKESFVKREHQDRFTSDGKVIVNNEPENIEIGITMKL